MLWTAFGVPMNSDLDEFHRPLRADYFWWTRGTRGRAAYTALVSSTHAVGDRRTVKHEHPTTNGCEPVNTDSLDDGSRLFPSQAACCEVPLLHMDIDAPRGERSALRCTLRICISRPTFRVSSLRLSSRIQVQNIYMQSKSKACCSVLSPLNQARF